MIIKLAFLKKKNDTHSVSMSSDINSLLSELFTLTENNEIVLAESDKVAIFEIKKNVLIVEIDSKPSTAAKELTQLYSKVVGGPHRKDFYIVLIADGVSEYYTEKMVPLINRFERQLRELIYLMMINEFGVDWIERINSDIRNELKRKKTNDSYLIENGLIELNLFEVGMLLFGEYSDFTSDELLDRISEEIKRGKTDTKSIQKMIRENSSKSLWYRLFDGSVAIDNLKNKLNEIRRFRNIIAHNKTFHAYDYKNCRKLLKSMNSQLESAIYKVENDKYNHAAFSNTLSEFLIAFSKSYATLLDSMTPSLEGIGAACLKMGEIVKSFNIPTYDQETLDSIRSLGQITLDNYQNISNDEVSNEDIDEEIDHEDV